MLKNWIRYQTASFIFSTVHNVLPDVLPANILAMYEVVEEFNR